MTVTTLTSQEFNRDNAGAKRAAKRGPVIITSRGEASHVLLSIEDYRRLTSDEKNIAELLASDDDVDIEFPRSRELARAAEF
ncbi:MAG: type II toxin-antitoxin system prevent-host-death family antitoxin [Rhizobiaceae bacterium]